MSGSNGNVLNPAGDGAILNSDSGAAASVPAGLLEVGPAGTGFEFQSISDALAAGNVRFPADPFVVLVFPGQYTENVTINRGGVSIFGFANQSFQTEILGNFTLNLAADGLVAISNLVVSGSFDLAGAAKTQLWSDNLSVQGPSTTLELTNSAAGTQFLGRNLRVVSTAGEPAIRYALTGAGAEVNIYGGNALIRAGGGPSDAIAVGIDIAAGGQLTIAGPNVIIDGRVEHLGTAAALVLTDVLVRSASATPVTINSINPVNTVSNSGLVAVAPPAPFAIDGTGVVGYLSVNDLTGGAGLAGTLAAAVNLQATWIP